MPGARSQVRCTESQMLPGLKIPVFFAFPVRGKTVILFGVEKILPMKMFSFVRFLLLAAAVLCGPAAPAGLAHEPLKSITVVADDNYPPYIFRDATGQLRGILPDQWALWEQKTGVKVVLNAMDWGEAQRTMRAGQADVIDTIFLTKERAKLYNFTPPYAWIEVPIFAHKALDGIADIDSLKGFTIGVKTGDAVVDYLKLRGVDSLREYPSYEAIILAAKNQELKVFSVDQPAAVYYLYKHGIANEFVQAFILYTGEFHRAVLKTRSDLLELVLKGFDQISRREYAAIDRKWLGSPFLMKALLQQWGPWLAGVVAAFLLLVAINVLLGRRIQAKTAELQLRLAELQKSEEDLLLSREYFATVFNATNDALFIHDAQTGQVLDVNQRMLEMYGFPTREEALAADLDTLCAGTPPYSKKDAIELIHKAVAHGQVISEWRARHRDGHLFWVEVSIRPARIRQTDRIIVAVRDISDRKASEEEEREYERRKQEAKKLESLGVLAGGIAHDFNNLLASIMGNADLALLSLPKNSPARDDLLAVVVAAKRAAHLVQQMLAYSGNGNFTPGRLDVSALVRETSQALRDSIAPRASLEIHLPESGPVIEADAQQLRTIISNLVSNASDALESRPGTIGLSVGVLKGQDLSPRQTWPHAPLPAGRYAYIEVADTGVGMAPDRMEKIFEPFYSTKFTGRGLSPGSFVSSA